MIGQWLSISDPESNKKNNLAQNCCCMVFVFSFFFFFVCVFADIVSLFHIFFFILTKQNFHDSSSIKVFFLICKQFLFIYSCLQKCFECQPPIVCHWHWLHRIFSFRFVCWIGTSLSYWELWVSKWVSERERKRKLDPENENEIEKKIVTLYLILDLIFSSRKEKKWFENWEKQIDDDDDDGGHYYITDQIFYRIQITLKSNDGIWKLDLTQKNEERFEDKIQMLNNNNNKNPYRVIYFQWRMSMLFFIFFYLFWSLSIWFFVVVVVV